MIGATRVPDRLYMEVALEAQDAERVAKEAAEIARTLMPKLSGAAAAGIEPLSGTGYIGLRWAKDHVWFQNTGIRPFTMRSLAGRVIPMWIDDEDGSERRANPKAKTRVMSGRTQVLIFRRAAKQGERKLRRNPDGTTRSVPASYPGAPGRIVIREAGQPWTTPGKVAGRIAAGNVGVRWRHPGLDRRGFLEEALERAVYAHKLLPGKTHAIHDGPMPMRVAA